MDLRSDRKFQSHKSADERKMIASFFTYQRLCENSLATWWRNVFLMSSVSLFILNTDDHGYTHHSQSHLTNIHNRVALGNLLISRQHRPNHRNSSKRIQSHKELVVDLIWNIFCVLTWVYIHA